MAGIVQALIGCFKAITACSLSGADSDWTATGTTATITAPAARTITVPSGNTGKLKLSVVLSSPGTMQYSKNAGTFTSFNQDDIITFVNSDTLKFKIISSGSGSSMIGPVVDNDTGNTIGNVSLTNTS